MKRTIVIHGVLAAMRLYSIFIGLIAFNTVIVLASTFFLYRIAHGDKEPSLGEACVVLLLFGIAAYFFILTYRMISFPKSNPLLIKFQVFRNEHPRLFQAIEEISNKINIDLPIRVHLTQDVNAFVEFYTGWRNLFKRANGELFIGLGLINSLSESELRTIIAHELGHFKQKSIHHGKFTLYAARITNCLLFEDKAKRGSEGFGFAAKAVIKGFSLHRFIINAYRMPLENANRKLVHCIGKHSRGLEFESDRIAAQTEGENPFRNALLRLEFITFSFQSTMNMYDWPNSSHSQNIYNDHRAMTEYLSKKYCLEQTHGYPKMERDDYERFWGSDLAFQNPFDTHPSTLDRIDHLPKDQFDCQSANEPAFNLLTNPAGMQEKFTRMIFAKIGRDISNPSLLMDSMDFEALMIEELPADHPRLRGYFYWVNILPFNVNESLNIEDAFDDHSLDDILTDQVMEECQTIRRLRRDIYGLAEILATKEINHFHYKGKLFKQPEGQNLAEKIEKQINEIHASSIIVQRRIFYYLWKHSDENGRLKLRNEAELYHEVHSFVQHILNQSTECTGILKSLYHNLEGQARKDALNLIWEREDEIRTSVAQMLSRPRIISLLDPVEIDFLTDFRDVKHPLFSKHMYLLEGMDRFWNVLQTLLNILPRIEFKIGNQLTEEYVFILNSM